MESFFADKQNEAILKKINLASYAININFDDYNSYCRRSALYESLGLFKLSLDDAVKAISIEKAKDDGYIYQAKAFAGLKRYSEAEKSLIDCLMITKVKHAQISNQLENLRYLAVKQIGFDDQVCLLASKRFNTINDSINGAFSMDLEHEAKEEEESKNSKQQNLINSSILNNNLNLNSNSNLIKNTTSQLTNNQLNQFNQINSQLNNQHLNHNPHLNSNQQINNQLNHNLVDNSTIVNTTLNSNIFLNSTNDKNMYTSANNHQQQPNYLSSNQLIDHQQSQQVHENPSSTVIDNTPLSELDLQDDYNTDYGTDFSSDLQQARSEGDLQMRSDQSDQTLIIDSARSLPHYDTPLKNFDLENDLFLTSPFTNNNSNSSIGLGDSLATPQFKRLETNQHQNKKRKVTKNLINDLIDNSENSPMYSPFSSSPPKCPESSPFSTISNATTPKSNVIVSPVKQSPFKTISNNLNDLNDLDELNNKSDCLNKTSVEENQSTMEVDKDQQNDQIVNNNKIENLASNDLTSKLASEKMVTTNKEANEDNKSKEIIYIEDNTNRTATNTLNTALTNGFIITGFNNFNNFNSISDQLTLNNSVIKTSANSNLIVSPMQVNLASLKNIILPITSFQPITTKVKPISTIAQPSSTIDQKANYITKPLNSYEHINIDKFFKEQNIVVDNLAKQTEHQQSNLIDQNVDSNNLINLNNSNNSTTSNISLNSSSHLLTVQPVQPIHTIKSINTVQANKKNKNTENLNKALTRRRAIGERIINMNNVCKTKSDENKLDNKLNENKRALE